MNTTDALNAVLPEAESPSSLETQDYWARVEKYVYGRLARRGGKPGLGLVFAETGEVLAIEATERLPKDPAGDALFQERWLHIACRQNLRTGELSGVRLLDLPDNSIAIDEAALLRMVERGTKAWREVPDASKWVDELRGNVGK